MESLSDSPPCMAHFFAWTMKMAETLLPFDGAVGEHSRFPSSDLNEYLLDDRTSACISRRRCRGCGPITAANTQSGLAGLPNAPCESGPSGRILLFGQSREIQRQVGVKCQERPHDEPCAEYLLGELSSVCVSRQLNPSARGFTIHKTCAMILTPQGRMVGLVN
jgi:hypothetical protein